MTHHIDCECQSCMVMRCVYALLVAMNRGDITRDDFYRAQLVLGHSVTMEAIDG